MQFLISSLNGLNALFRPLKRSTESKYKYRWENRQSGLIQIKSTINNPFDDNVGLLISGAFKRKTDNVEYFAGIMLTVIPASEVKSNIICDLSFEHTNKGLKEALSFDAASYKGNLIYASIIPRTDQVPGFVKVALIEVGR